MQAQICSQVTDRRDEVFLGPDLAGSFPGLGHVVGTSESSRVQETSKIPGKTFNLPRKCCSVLRRRILKPHQGSAGGRGECEGLSPSGSGAGASSTHRILSALTLLKNEMWQVIK